MEKIENILNRVCVRGRGCSYEFSRVVKAILQLDWSLTTKEVTAYLRYTYKVIDRPDGGATLFGFYKKNVSR